MFILFLIAVFLIGAGFLILRSLGNPVDRRTVPTLELHTLLGRWYELARFDHSFERGLTQVEARYELTDKGMIRVENSGFDVRSGTRRTAVGRAKPTGEPGRLRVSFFWKFYADYNILERGDRGEWMLVGSRSPRYLWILSRTPSLPLQEFERILDAARQRGYDTAGLILRDTMQAAR